MSTCIFCKIVARRAPARVIREWPDVIAFRDKNELVPDGHILVIPRLHVADSTTDPELTGRVMACAAEIAAEMFEFSNIMTANGRPATQSVFHMHAHVINRTPGDNLMIPWGTVATADPHAPHACKRALDAEEALAELSDRMLAMISFAYAFDIK